MNQNKSNLILIGSGIISLLLITIGLSFAYFTANLEGVETTTTIQARSGVLKIVYNGGPDIDAEGIEPDNNPFGTKIFTVTGTNTTNEDLEYHLMLVIEENSFSNDAIKYKLTSVNTDDNGEIAPSVDLTGVGAGDKEILLGNGLFIDTEGSAVHTYTLEVYFPETGIPQNEDQNKVIKAHVEVKEGRGINPENLLGNKILAQYGGADNIQEAPADTFSLESGYTDNLMYKMEDDYGDSYYFRGAKDHLSNNLIFAEHQWKIVRINGNGSIRIIYNGTCPNSSCTINDKGSETYIAETEFSTIENDNKYVGYMYGTSSTNYETAHANENDSTIKGVLDNWYENNIKGTIYEGYLSDTLFCNDRQLHSGDGFEKETTYYASHNRLQTNKTPTLKCSQKNDRFTVADTEIGNGDLTYPIALLTADEVSVAGLCEYYDNNNYLITFEPFWLLSPNYFTIYNIAYVWEVSTYGYRTGTGRVTYSNRGARGVLNLNSNIEVSGSGTTLDPYVVK